jgi:hypothetical protein
MLNNELDSWKILLNKEKIDHYNTLQNLSAAEFNLKKLREELDSKSIKKKIHFLK